MENKTLDCALVHIQNFEKKSFGWTELKDQMKRFEAYAKTQEERLWLVSRVDIARERLISRLEKELEELKNESKRL